jgi:hypothetical protein
MVEGRAFASLLTRFSLLPVQLFIDGGYLERSDFGDLRAANRFNDEGAHWFFPAKRYPAIRLGIWGRLSYLAAALRLAHGFMWTPRRTHVKTKKISIVPSLLGNARRCVGILSHQVLSLLHHVFRM